MDAGLARGVAEGTEPLQVAGFPGGDAFADSLVLLIEMRGPAGKASRHLVLVLEEQLLGHITQEGLLHHLDGNAGKSLNIPGRGLAFRDAEIVVAVHQIAGEAAEEDPDLKGRHLRIARDEAILIALTVEHQEMVFLAECNASLVEKAIVEADVFAFCFGCNLHDLERLDLKVVGISEGHHVGNEDGCAGTEATDGKGALDNAFDPTLQCEAFLQGELCASRIVAPVALLNECGDKDGEVDVAFEGQTP